MQKTTNFVELYKQAESRAVPCVGGRSGSGGKAFLKADRAALVSRMWELNMTANQAGYVVQKEIGGTSDGLHTARLRIFENQVNKGIIRMGAKATGEHVGILKINHQDIPFDGRIKSQSDIQPAFNRAARQLIKVGITNPKEVVKYINNAFETARVEQKIDIKAERIVNELRMGDLTKDQVLATLDRVKSQF